MRVTALTDVLARQAATVLHDAYAVVEPHPWPTPTAALAEVHEALGAERVALAAVDDDRLLGWVGASPTGYGRLTWELHPLAVDPRVHGAGVGTALVHDLLTGLDEREVATVLTSHPDTARTTSIGGVDLFPGVLDHLHSLGERRTLDGRRHPRGFLQRFGFEIVGVVPDATGPGLHDILLAVQVRRAVATRHADPERRAI